MKRWSTWRHRSPPAEPPAAGERNDDAPPVSAAPAVTPVEHLVRFDRPLFADPDLQDQVRRTGYAVGPPILDAEDCQALQAIGDDLLGRLTEPWENRFLASGRILDTDLRGGSTVAAGEIVAPRLTPLFIEGTRIEAASFQMKPPSPTSELNPHQDSSLIDEATWPSVYAWIPLVDTDDTNGCMYVVPGSHRFGNCQRTLQVPWPFAGLEETLRAHGIPIHLPAGRVLFFDAAAVHFSPPNLSSSMRLAVNAFATSPDAPMVHFYRDETTTPGMVEVYEIDLAFLMGPGVMSRPNSPYRLIEERPHVPLDIDAAQLDRMCREVKPASSSSGMRPR